MTSHIPGKLVVRSSARTWPTLVAEDEVLDPPVAQVDCSMSSKNRPYEEACANAERLAHCWNCHDELVEALKRYHEIIAGLTGRPLSFDEIQAVEAIIAKAERK